MSTIYRIKVGVVQSELFERLFNGKAQLVDGNKKSPAVAGL